MSNLSFPQWLEHQDLSEKTVSGYIHDVDTFRAWLGVTTRPGAAMTPRDVTPLDVRSYREHLLKGQKPATINRALAAIRQWLTWARDVGLIETNPAAGIRGVKASPIGPRWLSRQETYALLREMQRTEQVAAARAGGNLRHPAMIQARRDSAIIAVLLHAGLRVGELVALFVDDVEICERKGQVTVRYGKGGKERTIPLNVDARKAVSAWLVVRTPGAERLFHGKKGEPLTARGVEHLVAKYGRRAKLDLSPHNLRHTFGKSLVNAGTSLDRVAAMMGHEDVNTTKIYVLPSLDDLAGEVERTAWSD